MRKKHPNITKKIYIYTKCYLHFKTKCTKMLKQINMRGFLHTSSQPKHKRQLLTPTFFISALCSRLRQALESNCRKKRRCSGKSLNENNNSNDKRVYCPHLTYLFQGHVIFWTVARNKSGFPHIGIIQRYPHKYIECNKYTMNPGN